MQALTYHKKAQLAMFLQSVTSIALSRKYSGVIGIARNLKGVIDVDTVKGCSDGMAHHPNGGCYGECYAYKLARCYGFDFRTSICRQFMGREHRDSLIKKLMSMKGAWYRVGVTGEPSFDWTHTIAIVRALRHAMKSAVIVTKHWRPLTDRHIEDLAWLGAIINTSISGLDKDLEYEYRIQQHERLRAAGVKAVYRVVSCSYNSTDYAKRCSEKQEYIMENHVVIDNPLRANKNNPLVLEGHINITYIDGAIGGGKHVSVSNSSTHLGRCEGCADQCGYGMQL